ncbi:MAG: hypothetical protein ACREA0_02385 [bacterium]
MARKPSIILTPADKKSAAKDLRSELRVAKTLLKTGLAAVKDATRLAEGYAKEVKSLEERLEAMK